MDSPSTENNYVIISYVPDIPQKSFLFLFLFLFLYLYLFAIHRVLVQPNTPFVARHLSGRNTTRILPPTKPVVPISDLRFPNWQCCPRRRSARWETFTTRQGRAFSGATTPLTSRCTKIAKYILVVLQGTKTFQ